MKMLFVMVVFLAMTGCVDPRPAYQGPQTRDDGTLVPVPAYTNIPEVYHGR